MGLYSACVGLEQGKGGREGGREGICIQVTLHVNHAREINYGGADDGSK